MTNQPMHEMEKHPMHEMGKHSSHQTQGMVIDANLPNADSHVMEGIPTWMVILGIVLIILVSHLLVKSKKKPTSKKYWHYNLLRLRPLKALVEKSYFPLIAQSLSVFLFMLILAAGFFGNQNNNIATVLTWTWWWVLLIFIVLGFGKFFCLICPWEAISSIVTSFSLRSRIKKLAFDKPWPKWARNIFPAIIFFIILTWFELGHDVTRSPSMTATLGLVMLSMAVLSALIFEKRSFCRYACLVGRISGIYSLFSPLELRAQSTDVCSSCTTKDCYTGRDNATGCPTFLFPSKVEENSYCTLCTECVRSCPHDNIGINIRPVGTDLFHKTKFQWDESILAIVLLALTSFHGLTMTPLWERINNLLRVETHLGPMIIFTLLMTIMLILPVILFWFGAKVAQHLVKSENVSVASIFKAFAYSLIPVALFYHLAHNCMHFFMEAQHLFPLLSDPFGWGWNLFGTANKTYGALLSLKSIWYLQISCIVIGHIYGVIIADRVAKQLFKEPHNILKGLLPLIFTMILYSSFSVWLIAQPMVMRSGM